MRTTRSAILLATLAALTAAYAANSQPQTPPRWETHSPFGSQTVWPVNPHLEFYADQLQAAGAGWARSDLIWWSLAEAEPGEFNFTSPPFPDWQNWNTDHGIQVLVERGIEPFPILCYGNPHYDGGAGPSTEAGRAAFAEYCYQAASRYADSVKYWEIWNEPNLEMFWGRAPHPEDYALLAQAAAPRILEANPDAVIVGGAVAGIDLPFLANSFQHGLLDVVDVISVHPYRINAPESINSEIATLRSMITSHTDRDIQIWTGEWGYNTYWSNLTPLGQAKMLTRMMANNAAIGIEVSIWFSAHAFIETQGNPGDPEWGLFDFNLDPRPSYFALGATTDRLPPPVRLAHGAFDMDVPSAGGGVNTHTAIFELPEEDRYVAAIWDATWPAPDTYTGRTATVELSGLPERTEIRAYDGLDGGEITLSAEKNGTGYTLTGFRVQDYVTWIEVDVLPEVNEAWVLF